LTEYAALVAQFQAKNIWTGGFVRKEDIVRLKTDNPSMVLLESGHPQAATRWFPGILPDSPFKDERVRQAVSISLDRDLIVDIFDNVAELERQGLPLEVRHHTSIACGWDSAWLDPTGSSFGPNAQFYKYNATQAKQLLTAAGFPNGFDFDFHYRGTGYGAAYDKWVEVLVGSLKEVGIRAKQLAEDYNSVFLPGNRVEGKFTGARMIATSAQGDPVEMISNHYHSTGGFGIHQPPFTPEPDIDAMIDSMRKEFDLTKRLALVHEFQRVMAKRQRVLLFAGATPGLSMSWPWVGNYGVYRSYAGIGAGTESLVHYWYDESR
jgi:peptide/nickel transport system substrate-binding protein